MSSQNTNQLTLDMSLYEKTNFGILTKVSKIVDGIEYWTMLQFIGGMTRWEARIIKCFTKKLQKIKQILVGVKLHNEQYWARMHFMVTA